MAGTTGTGIHNDGGLIFGSQVVAIPFGGTTEFIAKNFKFDRPTALIESKDALGRPLKEAMVNQNLTGTITLSIIDLTTVAPANGTHFKLQPRGGGAPISFKISDNGEGGDQSGEGTFEISFRGYLNPPAP